MDQPHQGPPECRNGSDLFPHYNGIQSFSHHSESPYKGSSHEGSSHAAVEPVGLREGRGEITACVFCGHVDDPAAGLYKVGGGSGGWWGGGSVNTLSRSERCQTHSFPALPSQLIYSHAGLE